MRTEFSADLARSHQQLEDRFAYAAGSDRTARHSERHGIVGAQELRVIVTIRVETRFMQHVPGHPVTRRGGNISECNVLTLKIGQCFDPAVGCRDDQRLEGRALLMHRLGERDDLCSLALQHIGDRAQIGDVDAAKSQRFAGGGIVRPDDQLDRHLQPLLEISAQRLVAPEYRQRGLARQKADAQRR